MNKHKLYVGSLVLIWAVLISAMAGIVSIVGMSALFPAGGWIIIAIMALLESSKLLVAGWAHANWHSILVPRWLKGYLAMAVVILMLITNMGVYGFYSEAHIKQGTPTAAIQIEIDQKQDVIDQLTATKDQLTVQQTQINQTVTSYLENGRTAGASQFMRQQRSEQARIQAEINGLNTQITEANIALAPLKRDVAGSEAKLGPLKYAADLFGWEDPEAAVKLIIILKMCVFDPLAVAMMIAGTITLGEYFRERRKNAAETIVKIDVYDDSGVDIVVNDGSDVASASESNITHVDVEADAPAVGDQIRAEPKEGAAVSDPLVTQLGFSPLGMDETELRESLKPPKPKMGGIVEPMPNIFEKLVEKTIDDDAEKPDNRAMLVSILESDSDLMAEVIAAITAVKTSDEKDEVAASSEEEPTHGWLRHRPDVSDKS